MPEQDTPPDERELVEVKNVDGEPHDVGDGRVVPGETAWVDPDDPNVASLLASRALIPVPQPERFDGLTAAELVDRIASATPADLDRIEQAEQDRADGERVTVTRAIAHRRDELAADTPEGDPS